LKEAAAEDYRDRDRRFKLNIMLRPVCDFLAVIERIDPSKPMTQAYGGRCGGQPSRGLPTVAHAELASMSEGWRGRRASNPSRVIF
jgi:hypothetical protein